MRTQKLTLVVVPVLLTACSGSKTLQQDVYNNQYNCYQDWHFELCEPANENGESSYSGSTGVYIGPQYYKNNRKVRYMGQVLKARGRHSTGTPKISTHVFSHAKSQPIRGGFGRGGGSFGG